ncbi:unnamed protein product [Didymodactylos carnosus]|uniref:Uncharacterized protein n=1 Tax=Didymodactylos carnosus TaxID=1234261 RepID=A0A8S2RXM8_9BILA|nr:unnamed protein product [Didymodactylos carnosus]CAF4191816.1 unnamed protein product [Didymodactylos carnosus]
MNIHSTTDADLNTTDLQLSEFDRDFIGGQMNNDEGYSPFALISYHQTNTFCNNHLDMYEDQPLDFARQVLLVPSQLFCTHTRWVHESIRKIQSDMSRTSDTHLIKLALPAFNRKSWDLYLKDESTQLTG